jgi:hypothetical protein
MKTDNKIIQALKDNEKPFGLMTEEMRSKATEIGRSHNFEYYNHDNTWILAAIHGDFDYNSTYRLRSDYQEKPEIIECKVVPYNQSAIGYETTPGGSVFGLTHAFERANFLGFKYDTGDITHAARMYKSIDNSYICHAISDDDSIDNFLAVTPTHVLFRSKP